MLIFREEEEVPEQKLPDWLPAGVKEDAIKLALQVDDESADVLIRLTCDERMKRVWKLLEKRKPIHGTSVLDPCDPESLRELKGKPKASDARLKPHEGQRQFFRYAFWYADKPAYVITRSELNNTEDRYVQAAKELLKLGETLSALCPRFKKYKDQLTEMAGDVRMGWHDPYYERWVIERERSESLNLERRNIRRYVAEIANFNRIVFGGVLYGTVATVTNVAFDLGEQASIRGEHVADLNHQASITGEQVRQILRAPPTPVLYDPQ
jgi:hypothetical protein